MASTIKIKRSSVAGKRPTTSDIATGELALNTTDQKIYSSNGSVVFELGNAQALANTNSAIGNLNTNLTGTNTAIRALVSDRLQVANAVVNIRDLGDVANITPSDGHVLKFNSSNSTFTFAAESGGGGTTDTLARSGITATNTALRTLISDRLQVANVASLAALANTNSAIGNLNTNLTGTNTAIRTLVSTQTSRVDLINTNLTSTNTALRTLISDRVQVANVTALAALANTNSAIGNLNTNLTGTNTAIRTLVSTQTSRVDLINTNLTSTNTALRTLISDRLQVANASATYQTKAVERAALANTNAYIATKLGSSSYTASDVLTKIKTVDGTGSGLDADLLDGVQGSGYGRFYNDAVLNTSTDTASFIAELIADYGCFNNNQVTLKVQWSYANSSDLVTGHATIGTIELAGCTIETWGGTYKHIRISRPNTGTGGQMVIEYNDQGSGFSPGWREIWTSESDGSGSGLDADTLDGVQGASYLRSDASDSFTSGTLTVGGTALDVNVNMTAAGNITMDGSSKLLTLNDNSLDEFTEYARPLANSGTAITLDVSDNTQLYTLTGNCTFTLPALSNYPSNSSKSITIVVKQDGTGGRTVAFSATDGFSINNSASVPAPASGAYKVSIYTCIGIVQLTEWFISLSYIDD